jgi:hypothetical protein
MGVPLEEKALGENIHSLEEKLASVFFGEDVAGDSEPEEYREYESDANGDSPPDPLERNLYWESQEALLQVYIIN